MHGKNYKDAIKCFTASLKFNNAYKDAKYYRAICYLDIDNTKKCISELNELIEMDPIYNQTTYIVLSIAHRRTDDLSNAVKIVTTIFWINSYVSIVNKGPLKISLVCSSVLSKRPNLYLLEEMGESSY